MSTYAIGDVQGCYAELMALLNEVNFNPQEDQLWLAGDLINRGPDNLKTVKYLMSLDNIICVLGNHDLHFLAVASGCQRMNRKDTFSDILESQELNQIVDWFRHLPLTFVSQKHNAVMVHAGIPPGWSLDQVTHRAAEVEDTLRSDDFKAFLENMYSSDPCSWKESLAGFDRLRTTTNYLTRMRYCDQDGGIELRHKEKAQPKGYQPWFDYPNLVFPKHRVIFGHWAALGGIFRDALIGIDTGCVWGRHLSAYRLEDGKRFQVSAALES